MIYYAGIGSRRISVEEELYIGRLAGKFSDLAFTLYSGHADGSDMAFEKGADPDKSIIWLPWKGFNGKVHSNTSFVVGDREEGIKTMEETHPNPSKLSRGAKALMVRNHFQVFGDPPVYPMVDFVVCCADRDFRDPNKVKGGTGQAIRLCNKAKVPYFNIRYDRDRVRLLDYVNMLNM